MAMIEPMKRWKSEIATWLEAIVRRVVREELVRHEAEREREAVGYGMARIRDDYDPSKKPLAGVKAGVRWLPQPSNIAAMDNARAVSFDQLRDEAIKQQEEYYAKEQKH